ncbi:MAG: hypothetical protein WDM96_07715 [Lacunisphaera sp.]
MTGAAVEKSFPTRDDFGRFKIIMHFTKEGSARFAEVTRTIAEEGRRAGRRGRLAIVLDGKLESARAWRRRSSAIRPRSPASSPSARPRTSPAC